MSPSISSLLCWGLGWGGALRAVLGEGCTVLGGGVASCGARRGSPCILGMGGGTGNCRERGRGHPIPDPNPIPQPPHTPNQRPRPPFGRSLRGGSPSSALCPPRTPSAPQPGRRPHPQPPLRLRAVLRGPPGGAGRCGAVRGGAGRGGAVRGGAGRRDGRSVCGAWEMCCLKGCPYPRTG